MRILGLTSVGTAQHWELNFSFGLWTSKKMICHDISHDFPHQIPTTSSQELLCSRKNPGPSRGIPGVPQPAGETGGTRGNLVGKRTSCPWINSLKAQLPRLHGSLWIASEQRHQNAGFVRLSRIGESKGNHPQTTIRNVKQMRYIYIYTYIYT